MANIYVNSVAGSNTSPFDTWAKGATTLAAGLAAAVAGDDIWVAQDHAESSGSAQAVTFPGTLASPNRCICANRAGTVPPVSADLRTTGSLATTGAFAFTFAGCAYVYGLTIINGSGANSPDLSFGAGVVSQTELYLDACAVQQGGTSGGRCIVGGTANSIGYRLTWNNTTYQVASVNSTIQLTQRNDFLWKNTASAITGATLPTNLFGANAVGSGYVVLDGVDLSAISAKTVIAAQAAGGVYTIKDCKLPASVTVNAAPTSTSTVVYLIRSDSGARAYRFEKHDARGDQTTETTIVRSGGSSINTTPVAMKIVATSGAHFNSPFISTPLVVTSASAGASVTCTLYGVWAGVAVPTNDQVWMEVGYLGDASTPRLSFNSGTKADTLATGANQTTDAISSWGGGTTKFKMVTTVTPQLAGEIYVTVKVASTNATYIDPQVYLS